MRSILGLSLLPLLAAASPVLVDTIHKDAAPVVSSTNAKHIEDSYMIIFKKHVTSDSAAVHQSWVQEIHTDNQYTQTELRKRSQFPFRDTEFEGLKHTYDMPGMLGYSGHFHEDVIELIRRHPDVEYIERDSEVHTMKDDDKHLKIEKSAPWGLARLSHRKHLNFGTFNKYMYTENGGEGVDAYVIDTGTNVDHVDFGGRAHWSKSFTPGENDDGNGHGTHCSGTIAGENYGVAKKANIYAVKVLRDNGSGAMSGVVKGVEHAANEHIKSAKAAKDGKKKGFKGSVANMSLGGGKSTTLDLAVNAAVDAGLHFAVAAGNDNADACNYSPAGAKKAVTVCASTLGDERAYFSNYGTCTDIFAPGLNIKSTWIGSKYATNTISGTSMASPHICGLLAYFLSLQPDTDSAYAVDPITPKKLKEIIVAIATPDVLTDVSSDTPNLLAWNGGGSGNWTEIIQGADEEKTGFGRKYLDSVVKPKSDKLRAELKEIAREIEALIEEA